jgi:hypothetical protein
MTVYSDFIIPAFGRHVIIFYSHKVTLDNQRSTRKRTFHFVEFRLQKRNDVLLFAAVAPRSDKFYKYRIGHFCIKRHVVT